MYADTWLLANQKYKPKSKHLDYFKVVDIINEEFKSTLKPLTVRRYDQQGPIDCSQLKRGPHGKVVNDVANPILLKSYITHYQILQANGKKWPNLKDLVTPTNLTMNIKNRSNAKIFVQNRLCYDASVTFQTSKKHGQ